MAVTAAKSVMAFRVLTMAVDLCRLTTRTMNVNAGHERTSKARIIHQIQLIRGITSDGNTATGVAVKLYESDRNTQIKIGDISQSIDLAEGEDSKTLNFYANYNATTDVVSTGEADADANFLMVYN